MGKKQTDKSEGISKLSGKGWGRLKKWLGAVSHGPCLYSQPSGGRLWYVDLCEFESTLQNESQSGYSDKPCLDFPPHSKKKKKLARVNLLGVEYVQNVLY